MTDMNLEIDCLHGFVFSAIAAPPHVDLTKDDYEKSLDWLLEPATRSKT